MHITKFFIVFVILTARIYRAEILIRTSKPNISTSILVKVLVKIVTSCYKDRINAIGLVGHLPDTLIRTLSAQDLIPAILIDDRMIKAEAYAPNQFRYKLQLFVVSVSSWEQLGTIISRLKRSIWWNHMASFIILDWTPGCRLAKEYLFSAWQLKLLNTKVMCFYRGRPRPSIFFFHYNPFTRQAPVSWTPTYVMKAMKKHPFTYFVQEYRGNDAICGDLDFDKTNNLGGYEITVEGNDKVLSYKDKNFRKTSEGWAGRKMVLYSIYRIVNAVPKFTGRDGRVNKTDAEMSIRHGKTATMDGFSYPYQQLGVVIVSNFKGHKSQLEKIMSVTDVNTRIGMGIVYLMTMIFFKFFVSQTLASAILNLVRMTCNTGFTNLSDNNAPRLYLTGLLFFVVTMQGIYQGNLASLLTNIIPYQNINSISDLVNCDCKIYCTKDLSFLLQDSGLKERVVNVENPYDCIMHVINNVSAVCLEYADGVTVDMAAEYDLHLSTDFVIHVPVSFGIQPSWYLEERMNGILGRMMEADIFEVWDRKCHEIKLSDFKYDKEVLKNTDYKVMELSELLFAFIILGIGLTCATFVFIVELALYRCENPTSILYCVTRKLPLGSVSLGVKILPAKTRTRL